MYILSFIILFAFWFIFSGRTDLFHLCLGLISVLTVIYFSKDLFFNNNIKHGFKRFKEISRLPKYFLWLVYEIVNSNLYMLKLVFSRDINNAIDPVILEFDSSILNDDLSRVLFASSITLTPGTLTVSLVDKHYIVHSISPKLVADLSASPGNMEKKVAKIFKD